jgi:hypothetical protein
MSTQFVNVVGYNTPHQEIIFLLDEPRWIDWVFCNELDNAPTSIKTLDGAKTALRIPLGFHW